MNYNSSAIFLPYGVNLTKMRSRSDLMAKQIERESEEATMYTAPTDDMQFLIDDVLNVGSVLGSLPQYAELGLGNELTTALLARPLNLHPTWSRRCGESAMRIRRAAATAR